MSDNVRVMCGHCSGEGYVVHARATQMLALIERGWASTGKLAKRMRIGATNAANIAALLLELGHVQRRGSGARHSPYEWSKR
jgi:DNA-binding IclR family transcriptional regulator